MKLARATVIALVALAALVTGVYFALGHDGEQRRGLGSAVEWQRMANPGPLSQAHAFLSHNCKACHTPVKGVEAVNCIVCHANDETILQRQPTAFHANIGRCQDCHREHEGRASHITRMDHSLLADIGLRQLDHASSPDDESAATALRLKQWIRQAPQTGSSAFTHPRLSPRELTLNCASCHQNDDRHFALFGNDCAACHETTRWNLPEFRHPSSNSKDCAQCHQAPPSHYMGHFKMISAKVAGKPHAKVSECYTCHQTTSWPDIKGVGWYKHH